MFLPLYLGSLVNFKIAGEFGRGAQKKDCETPTGQSVAASELALSVEMRSAGEVATLTAEDAAIAHSLALEVPAWADFDLDTMCAFVRSYKSYTPRLPQTVWHVRHVIGWISSLDYELPDILRSPPDGRSEFEAMYQAGPVGWDSSGRAVVVERLGSIPARQFCARFSDAEVVRHSVYNREAAVALNRALSHEAGRLIHRITPVIDLKGFGFEHLSSDFLSRTRATITSLQHAYPEAVSGFYVINAPSVFTILWSIVRPMLDEHTAAIVYVLGGRDEYTPVLERLGVSLEDGHADIETCPASWQAAMDVVAPDGVKPPPFVPSSDARALRTALSSAGLKMPTSECYSERRPIAKSRSRGRGRGAILSSVSGSAKGGADAVADDGETSFDVRLGPDGFHGPHTDLTRTLHGPCTNLAPALHDPCTTLTRPIPGAARPG